MNDAERALVDALTDAVLGLMAHVENMHRGSFEELSTIPAWRDGNKAVKLKWKMFPPHREHSVKGGEK